MSKRISGEASLLHSFFCQPVITVAQKLLGQTLLASGHRVRITETEAYGGTDDPLRGKSSFIGRWCVSLR